MKSALYVEKALVNRVFSLNCLGNQVERSWKSCKTLVLNLRQIWNGNTLPIRLFGLTNQQH